MSTANPDKQSHVQADLFARDDFRLLRRPKARGPLIFKARVVDAEEYALRNTDVLGSLRDSA